MFDDIFQVKDVDPEGKKFDRVSRIHARSENYEAELSLDVHYEMYPLAVGEKFAMVLASSLRLDGAKGAGPAEDESYDPTVNMQDSLADKYDYVMYGKVFKYEPQAASKV